MKEHFKSKYLPGSLLLIASTFLIPVSLADNSHDAQTAADIGMLAQKPVPPTENGTGTTSYHEVDFELSDPRSKEKLIDLSSLGIAGKSFYAASDGLNAPYHRCVCGDNPELKMRVGAARLLQKANERLEPLGLELFVLDAYRTIECQKKLWTFFKEEARRILGAKASTAEINSYAARYCSNPGLYNRKDSKTWPTHFTGGAVDLTLRRKSTGELMFMGGIFDDASALSHTAHFEKVSEFEDETAGSSASSMEARKNRRLLYWVMTEAGFSNYPNEWWHYDFGNQMWIKNGRKDAGQKRKAFYGAI